MRFYVLSNTCYETVCPTEFLVQWQYQRDSISVFPVQYHQATVLLLSYTIRLYFMSTGNINETVLYFLSNTYHEWNLIF